MSSHFTFFNRPYVYEVEESNDEVILTISHAVDGPVACVSIFRDSSTLEDIDFEAIVKAIMTLTVGGTR